MDADGGRGHGWHGGAGGRDGGDGTALCSATLPPAFSLLTGNSISLLATRPRIEINRGLLEIQQKRCFVTAR